MLQGALIKFDQTVFLRTICHRNGLIMCIVIHETRRDQEELKFESSMLIYCGNVFW